MPGRAARSCSPSHPLCSASWRCAGACCTLSAAGTGRRKTCAATAGYSCHNGDHKGQCKVATTSLCMAGQALKALHQHSTHMPYNQIPGAQPGNWSRDSTLTMSAENLQGGEALQQVDIYKIPPRASIIHPTPAHTYPEFRLAIVVLPKL